jgi:hypothetical protein
MIRAKLGRRGFATMWALPTRRRSADDPPYNIVIKKKTKRIFQALNWRDKIIDNIDLEYYIS